MKILIFKLIFILLVFIFLLPQNINADEGINCGNRFVTLVNPVRNRSLWHDKSVKPLISQYGLIKQINAPATWLLQYDVLTDLQLLAEIKKFDKAHELGVFLEVSPVFAEASRVIYPDGVPWYSPGAVFLSSYTQSERRRLLDTVFRAFKDQFGSYPTSVGAWWIDSYSLNYLKEKYNITTALIVADQKTTDNYGVWGQWWGVPYYPSKANILTPASSLVSKQNVVVLQWAQRDPILAVGEGTKFSNYSLQANDYIRQGKNTDYFKNLVNVYLSCQNPIGQVTVGLETGIESIGHIREYQNQLTALKEISSLQFVTMRQMSEKLAKVYQGLLQGAQIKQNDSIWEMTTAGRVNKYFNDQIKYQSEISFSDYFIADRSEFLSRYLQNINKQKNTFWFPWFPIVVVGLLIIAYQRKMIRVWVISILFTLAAFGLILRSYYQFGWSIYFGPKLQYLEFFQMLVILVSFGLVWFINKQKIFKIYLYNLWLLPLIFGFDFIIQTIRFSLISGKYYIGFALDALRFVGVTIKPFGSINLINQDFPSYISAAFLRVTFNNFWRDPLQALLLYPLAHIILALSVGILIVKLPLRLQKIFLAILIILFLLQLGNIFNADPRQVTPILLQ